MFKQNQIVIVDFTDYPEEFKNAYPFKHNERLLFLGEIINMPGHCIVVNEKGQVLWGYHTDAFREPNEDEI